MDQEQIRKYAERRVKKKISFRVHLLVYILVNFFILATRLISGDSLNWGFIFPALPWGIGLAFHAYFVYFDSDPLAFEKQVQKEMEKYMNKNS